VQTPSNDQVMYFDFSGGALVYSSGFWMGVAVDHLSKPNQSLVADGQSMLPLKLSLHTGLKIPLGYVSATRQVFLSPALNYRNQQNFNQLDLGVYFSNDPMIVGLWYRGIPFLKTTESAYVNNDALAVLVGFTADRLRVGYSYDLSVSRLIGSTGGSHELSLSYQFCDYKKLRVKKSRKISSIPCPSF
jgi:type IX secretion system PorP/SprF family membrane protein